MPEAFLTLLTCCFLKVNCDFDYAYFMMPGLFIARIIGFLQRTVVCWRQVLHWDATGVARSRNSTFFPLKIRCSAVVA